MAKPETLPLINGVLDYRRQVTNPFTNEVITSVENFNVIAAINEGYIGTVPLNEALKNRFIVIDVPYIQGEQLMQLIQSNTRLEKKSLVESFVTLSGEDRKSTRLNSSHVAISYAVFCLKKKKKQL